MYSKYPPLIVILGPTAVGKTAMSLALAQKFNGEIVSADSRLFYRGLDIGTAKPSQEEQKLIPHHLIDVAEPDATWSLGKFKHQASIIIEEITARGNVPFLVGGTGQFIRAITEGWVVPEFRADEEMRQVLTRWSKEIGPEGMYQRLKVIDPEAAKNILPGNVRRTIRAFEVIFNSGQKFSQQRQKEPVPYRILQIGLNRPREELDQRIEVRVDEMIRQGFLQEVENLIAQGYRRDLPSMSALGYNQLSAFIAEEASWGDTILEIKKVSKKFYRRQMNWFKLTNPGIHWFDLSVMNQEDIEKEIILFLSG